MKAIVAAGTALITALTGGFYTTKTPYAPQQSQARYQDAPRGYRPVFTENVARHGSRAMSDGDDGATVLAVLQTAGQQRALTVLGTRLGPQVEALLAGAQTIGYGNLSGRGRQEQQQIARRLEQRLPTLFATIATEHEPIEVVTSGVTRAVDSANAFTGALAAGDPAIAPLIEAPVTDKDLLYFHKQPQNAGYQDYLDNDPELAATLAEIDGRPRTATAATDVVSRLFRPAFVTAMTGADRIAFAKALYGLYSAAPDLSVEAPGVDLHPYLPPADAEWFAYLDDAEGFYENGPAFSGRTITYAMAGVLLDDLLAQAAAKAAGTSGAGAVLRFTHAEELEPLAVLLGLPGSTKPADQDQPFAYATNPWRGAQVAPMAANIQWDLYAGHGRHLIRMLYNEKETAFKASCTPIARGSYFYDLTELQRCYA